MTDELLPPVLSGTNAGKGHKLMYGNGEQLVWLVWELAAGRPTLAVICTTNEDLARYVTPDKKTWHRGGGVFVEKVMTNHLYGANDAAIAVRILRNGKTP